MNYKNVLIFTIALLVLNTTYSVAQVKIGASPTTIDPNSLLELEQSTSSGRYGLRLPRVSLTATDNPAPMTSHVVGMQVYNTANTGSGATSVTPGEYINDGTQWVKIASSSSAALPAGMIAPYAGSGFVAPSGWLLCDGSTISRTTYANLFAVIGTTYGAGDGSTTFTLPNAKGVYLRGWGSQTIGGTTYTAPTQGTSQIDATKMPNVPFVNDIQGDHNHSFTAYVSWMNVVAGQGPYGGFSNGWGGSTTTTNGAHTHTITGGDSETRPASIVVTYIIKY